MIKSNYLVNEPILLNGRHRVQGEHTELIPDSDITRDLCSSGAITKLGSVIVNIQHSFGERVIEIKDSGHGKEEVIARRDSKLDTHTDKKKKPKR